MAKSIVPLQRWSNSVAMMGRREAVAKLNRGRYVSFSRTSSTSMYSFTAYLLR